MEHTFSSCCDVNESVHISLSNIFIKSKTSHLIRIKLTSYREAFTFWGHLPWIVVAVQMKIMHIKWLLPRRGAFVVVVFPLCCNCCCGFTEEELGFCFKGLFSYVEWLLPDLLIPHVPTVFIPIYCSKHRRKAFPHTQIILKKYNLCHVNTAALGEEWKTLLCKCAAWK